MSLSIIKRRLVRNKFEFKHCLKSDIPWGANRVRPNLMFVTVKTQAQLSAQPKITINWLDIKLLCIYAYTTTHQELIASNIAAVTSTILTKLKAISGILADKFLFLPPSFQCYGKVSLYHHFDT